MAARARSPDPPSLQPSKRSRASAGAVPAPNNAALALETNALLSMVKLGTACVGPGGTLGMNALRTMLLSLGAWGALAASDLETPPKVDTRKQFVRLALFVDDKRVAEAMQIMRNPANVDPDRHIAASKIKTKTTQLLAELFSVSVEGGGTASTFSLLPEEVKEIATAAVVGRLPGTPLAAPAEKAIVAFGPRHAIYRLGGRVCVAIAGFDVDVELPCEGGMDVGFNPSVDRRGLRSRMGVQVIGDHLIVLYSKRGAGGMLEPFVHIFVLPPVGDPKALEGNARTAPNAAAPLLCPAAAGDVHSVAAWYVSDMSLAMGPHGSTVLSLAYGVKLSSSNSRVSKATTFGALTVRCVQTIFSTDGCLPVEVERRGTNGTAILRHFMGRNAGKHLSPAVVAVCDGVLDSSASVEGAQPRTHVRRLLVDGRPGGHPLQTEAKKLGIKQVGRLKVPLAPKTCSVPFRTLVTEFPEGSALAYVRDEAMKCVKVLQGAFKDRAADVTFTVHTYNVPHHQSRRDKAVGEAGGVLLDYAQSNALWDILLLEGGLEREAQVTLKCQAENARAVSAAESILMTLSYTERSFKRVFDDVVRLRKEAVEIKAELAGIEQRRKETHAAVAAMRARLRKDTGAGKTTPLMMNIVGFHGTGSGQKAGRKTIDSDTFARLGADKKFSNPDNLFGSAAYFSRELRYLLGGFMHKEIAVVGGKGCVTYSAVVVENAMSNPKFCFGRDGTKQRAQGPAPGTCCSVGVQYSRTKGPGGVENGDDRANIVAMYNTDHQVPVAVVNTVITSR